MHINNHPFKTFPFKHWSGQWSQEFARKTMERMLRQEEEEEERERHENQTAQAASASKGTWSTNAVELGRHAAAASRDVKVALTGHT